MLEPRPRTIFVHRTIADRPYGPDEGYALDLLELERLLSGPSLGLVGSLSLGNLMSRYPVETDAIIRELGVSEGLPIDRREASALAEERLFLAEQRRPARGDRGGGRHSLTEY